MALAKRQKPNAKQFGNSNDPFLLPFARPASFRNFFGAWRLAFGICGDRVARFTRLTDPRNPPLSAMPIDYNYEHTPGFRDVTRTSFLLLKQPMVRSLAKLRRLRQGRPVPEGPAIRTAKTFAGVR
jgi:hypothetical protein